MCCIDVSACIMPFTKARCELCKCCKEKGPNMKSVKQLQWLRTQKSDAHIENDYAQSSRYLSRYYGRDNGTTTTNIQFRTNEKKII